MGLASRTARGAIIGGLGTVALSALGLPMVGLALPACLAAGVLKGLQEEGEEQRERRKHLSEQRNESNRGKSGGRLYSSEEVLELVRRLPSIEESMRKSREDYMARAAEFRNELRQSASDHRSALRSGEIVPSNPVEQYLAQRQYIGDYSMFDQDEDSAGADESGNNIYFNMPRYDSPPEATEPVFSFHAPELANELAEPEQEFRFIERLDPLGNEEQNFATEEVETNEPSLRNEAYFRRQRAGR